MDKALFDERQPKLHQQPLISTDRTSALPGVELRGLTPRRLSLVIIILFWITQFVSASVVMHFMYPSGRSALFLPRTLVCILGALFSWCILLVQDRLRSRRLSSRAYWAVAFAFGGAAAVAAVNHLIFTIFVPERMGSDPFWSTYLMEVMDRFWVFSCISAIILAISYSDDVREQQQEIASLQSLAQDAQLSALRTQLNPHFLFNALNSLAALVQSSRNSEAEALTENLADFLRIALSLDPRRLIRLEEEIELQNMYLQIQELRFPKRLRTSFDISGDAAKALVPNLIVQPLVENSIKYAVARSTSTVNLTISAESSTTELTLIVEDDGGNADDRPVKGSGVGLTNVAERLRLHFGEKARFSAGPKPGGGFRNLLVIPVAAAA